MGIDKSFHYFNIQDLSFCLLNKINRKEPDTQHQNFSTKLSKFLNFTYLYTPFCHEYVETFSENLETPVFYKVIPKSKDSESQSIFLY